MIYCFIWRLTCTGIGLERGASLLLNVIQFIILRLCQWLCIWTLLIYSNVNWYYWCVSFIKLKEDGTSLSVVDYVVSLEERTLFEGFCSLEYEQVNHWVTEFSFNISNDGSRFTENFYVYTYQSLCQEYRNDTGNITFIFKVKAFRHSFKFNFPFLKSIKRYLIYFLIWLNIQHFISLD